MEDVSLGDLVMAFAVKLANIYQDNVANKSSNIVFERLLDSCVRVGVDVRDYEFSNGNNISQHLKSALENLKCAAYWLDLAYETGAITFFEYESLSSEHEHLTKKIKETVKYIV